jgi:hypothetical protein
LYQKKRQEERKAHNKEFSTNHPTSVEQVPTGSLIWPVSTILTSKATISAEKQADIRSMLKYMPPIDVECLQSILNNTAVVKAATKVGKNKATRKGAHNE